jgi:ubiquinone/menaquinone biosynthesis C-methylase UbiE
VDLLSRLAARAVLAMRRPPRLTIEIAQRHYLAYLLLPHPLKMALLSPQSRTRLDLINQTFNEEIYSGESATSYDRIHRYAEAEQHEYPAQLLISNVWAPDGYGRALEVGAGTGYFTAALARRAETVLAVEPVADMRQLLEQRCRREGLTNIQVRGGSAFDLSAVVPDASIDSACLIQSLHHFHRREEIFAALGRAVRPGGRLFLVEPHHNLRRLTRLVRHYFTTYRAPGFWRQERNWATHDFLTRREVLTLCRRAGFRDVRISAFWFPYSRRLVPDPRRRFDVERILGAIPLFRHVAGVLSVVARKA